MPRRQSEVLRNLDTPLKVVGIITIKSCGVVLLYFVCTQALDMLHFWTLIAGRWAWFVQNGSVLVLALILVYIERNEDEHLVPQAISWFVSECLWVEPATGDSLIGETFNMIAALPRYVREIVMSRLGLRQVVYSGVTHRQHNAHPLEEIFNP